jgi:hypothetical protein
MKHLWSMYGVSMEFGRHGVGMESACGRLAVGMESAYSRHVILVFFEKRLYIYLETNKFSHGRIHLRK